MAITFSDLKHTITRPSRREQLAEISFVNSEIVDDLIKEAKRLAKSGKADDASRLIDIAEKVVDNNKKYQSMVGKVLLSAG